MLTLSLVTPGRKIFTGVEIQEVFVPTESGELNILEGHAPLMALLDTGVLKYRTQGQQELTSVAISWGYLEVSQDRVTVLAETAETAEVIDLPRARAAKVEAEKELQRNDLEEADFKKYQLKLDRAEIRLQVAEHTEVAGNRTTH